MVRRGWTKRNHDQAFDAIIERALTKIGINITGQAMLLAPVLTGRLAGSITWAIKSKQSDVVSPSQLPGKKGKGPGAKSGDKIRKPTKNTELWVGTNVKYAEAIEYGHRRKTSRKGALASLAGRVASQGFLRKSLDMNRKDAAKILREELRREYG